MKMKMKTKTKMKMKMKNNASKSKAAILLLIMMMAFCTLAGCGSGENEGEAKADEQGTVTYIAATEPSYAPFDSTDEDGNIVGFDMDLLDAIGEDQGFKVEYQAFEFDAIIPAIQAGNADIIAAAMNVTEDRAEKVDFSDAYYNSGKVLLVKLDNDEITSIDDLTADMKVAAQISTWESEYIQELAEAGTISEAVILNQTTDCVLQLQNGDVQAVIMDAPVAEYYENNYKDEIKQLDTLLEPSPMAFAVAKGNSELLEKINTGLANVKENGVYDELKEKWFS